MTDNKKVCQFKTDKQADLKKIEQFNGWVGKRMTSAAGPEEEMEEAAGKGA